MIQRSSTVLLLCAVGTLLGCLALPARAEDNALTDQEKAQGWKLLFDGKTLDGWKVLGRSEGWAVEDGAITCMVKGGNYLRTVEQYGNFVLSLDFKIAPRCNSGIRLRSVDPNNDKTRGLEIQILDSYGKAKPGRGDCGAIYDCLAPSKNMCKKAGEWNTYVITCKGHQITVELNGEKICDMDENQWSVAHQNPDGTKNKFPTAPKEMAMKGYLALQDHGGRVWFKNVKVLPLPADAK